MGFSTVAFGLALKSAGLDDDVCSPPTAALADLPGRMPDVQGEEDSEDDELGPPEQQQQQPPEERRADMLRSALQEEVKARTPSQR